MGSAVERINNLIKDTERTRNISKLNKTVIELKDRITSLENENQRLKNIIIGLSKNN